MRNKIIQFIVGVPVATWVIAGFLAPYLFFYYSTLFLTSDVMPFTPYVPAFDPIGADFKVIINYSQMWLENKNPYEMGYMYPPFSIIFFAPLTFLPKQASYLVLSLLTFVAYVVSFSLAFKTTNIKASSYFVIAFVFVSGLFSYPLHFEIERGQYNFLVFFLCYLSIYFYYKHSGLRYLGYVLFTLAVQLKVFPFIFCLMFVYDWRNWRRDARRLLVLSLVNALLTVVLGTENLSNFLNAIKPENAQAWVWKGSHSILSFLTWIKIILVEDYHFVKIRSYVRPLEYLFLLITCLIALAAVMVVYLKKKREINPELFLIVTLAALLIPGISNDYKLPVLYIPFSMFLIETVQKFEMLQKNAFKLYFIGFIIVTSALFFSLNYSYTYKPPFLQNNFPVLFLLLVFCGIHQIIMWIYERASADLQFNRVAWRDSDDDGKQAEV